MEAVTVALACFLNVLGTAQELETCISDAGIQGYVWAEHRDRIECETDGECIHESQEDFLAWIESQ
jgi:hypothetical protein